MCDGAGFRRGSIGTRNLEGRQRQLRKMVNCQVVVIERIKSRLDREWWVEVDK